MHKLETQVNTTPLSYFKNFGESKHLKFDQNYYKFCGIK